MFRKYLSIFIVAFLSLQALPAFAEGWERHEGRDHHWGFEDRRLPHGYVALVFRGRNFFYNEGLFYSYTPTGYVYVQPPIGAVVPALPPGYTTVVVQQTPYYSYQNVYYVATPSGYVVSAPPVGQPAAQPLPVSTPSAPEQVNPAPGNINSYDIYIPNDNGSYTLVTLKKAEKGGFVGPQGEFYPEHPTVEQLKTLYGSSKK